MKIICVFALLLAGLTALGQDGTITLDDALQAAQQWAKENPDALRALGNVDQEKVKAFLNTMQQEFQGSYVIDLAELRGTAKAIQPILEQYEETRPYALWLNTRTDYLDTAEELRLIVPPPKVEPGKPPPRPPNPSPQQEREIWIKKISERPSPKEASPYVTHLKPIFVEENVPPELVWIAEVESSFDPRARSPVGAAGMFQLMPATAKQYGLSTWPFDQRLKPDESGHAAAKYLNYLYGQFKDWRLAVAAYNAGEGTVQNLLKRSKTKTYDAIATRLPAETQMYVPKLEATILRRERVKLSELPPPRE
jgi:membrane-bound lytic murein transglycosylase D